MLSAVFLAAFGIVYASVRIHVHRIYREVSSSDVFFDRALENNLVRSSEIRISSVFPESRNFNIAFIRHCGDGSVLCCVVVEIDACFPEYLYCLFRLCGSRHIVIVRHSTKNDVTNGTAGNIGLEALIFDQSKDITDISGNPFFCSRNIVHTNIIPEQSMGYNNQNRHYLEII